MNTTIAATNNPNFIKTCFVLDDRVDVIVHFPTRESILIHIIVLLFVITLTFTTVFLNGVTVLTIWRSQLLKQRTSNFTILLQSIIDLVNGVVMMPIIVVHIVSEVAGQPKCAIVYMAKKSAMLMFLCSIVTLSAMNFDRYMGVLHPFIHRCQVTNKRLLAYVVSVCTLETVIHGFGLIYNEIIRYFLITTTMLFISTTVFVYLRIFFKIRETNRIIPIIKVESFRDGDASKTQKKRNFKMNFMKEIKAAKSSFLVIICCLACFLPVTLSFGALNLNSSIQAIAIRLCFVVLAMLNSTLNSIIHFWMNAQLRNQGKELLKTIFKS